MEQAAEQLKKYCERCGTAAPPQARFCGACGQAIEGLAQPGTQLSPGDSQSVEGTKEQGLGSMPMDLGTAWMIYLAAMLIWLAGMALPKVPLGTLAYLVAGFVMTRYVMRGLVEFHPAYDTVANVFSAKIWMFLLWPVHMFILLFKLTVNRLL